MPPSQSDPTRQLALTTPPPHHHPSVEYDCSIGILGQSNYCLHFLSREPLGFDQTLLQALVHNATVVMGLNPENRILNITTQDDGCWA